MRVDEVCVLDGSENWRVATHPCVSTRMRNWGAGREVQVGVGAPRRCLRNAFWEWGACRKGEARSVSRRTHVRNHLVTDLPGDVLENRSQREGQRNWIRRYDRIIQQHVLTLRIGKSLSKKRGGANGCNHSRPQLCALAYQRKTHSTRNLMSRTSPIGEPRGSVK